jgi:hypothetical protein
MSDTLERKSIYIFRVLNFEVEKNSNKMYLVFLHKWKRGCSIKFLYVEIPKFCYCQNSTIAHNLKSCLDYLKPILMLKNLRVSTGYV